MLRACKEDPCQYHQGLSPCILLYFVNLVSSAKSIKHS